MNQQYYTNAKQSNAIFSSISNLSKSYKEWLKYSINLDAIKEGQKVLIADEISKRFQIVYPKQDLLHVYNSDNKIIAII